MVEPMGSASYELARRRKLTVLATCGAVTSCTIYILSAFLAPAFRRICLPFVPATPNQIDSVARVLLRAQQKYGLRSLGSVIDLGSGDGRVLLSLLKRPELKFSNGFGVELNRPLVWYSKWKAFRSNDQSQGRISFTCGDIWQTDLSKYQTIIVFGVDSMMTELEQKLKREAKPGCLIITCRFALPTLSSADSIEAGPDSVYFYRL